MPQFGSRANRMTIYDLMDAKGVFAQNPANIGSMAEDGRSLYAGPVPFPKMLYHPKGEQRVLVPERTEPTPVGPVKVPAQMEMIHRVVQNETEYEDALAEGWHEHPADALGASGQVAPPKSSDARIKSLEAEIERLKKRAAPSRSRTGSTSVSADL